MKRRSIKNKTGDYWLPFLAPDKLFRLQPTNHATRSKGRTRTNAFDFVFRFLSTYFSLICISIIMIEREDSRQIRSPNRMGTTILTIELIITYAESFSLRGILAA